MKILITGASGFVGTNLLAYLAARGHELVAIRGSGVAASALSHSFTWSELHRVDWPAIDAVVHLAGKAHDTKSAGDPQSYYDTNVGLTKKLVDVCLDQGAKAPKAFVFFSSVKAVADRAAGVLSEDAVPNPQTPYGKSKLEAEGVVWSAFDRGASAARGYILRPCMIHGPGNKGNLNLLYQFVNRGIPWPLGAFENRRSFASIGNVCAAVETLLAATAPSGVYQVADDEALSTNEVVRLIAESIGREPRIWRLPMPLVRGMARAGDLLRLPLDSERLKKLTESYVVSNEKLKQALGWQRMPVGARDGLRETLASFARQP